MPFTHPDVFMEGLSLPVDIQNSRLYAILKHWEDSRDKETLFTQSVIFINASTPLRRPRLLRSPFWRICIFVWFMLFTPAAMFWRCGFAVHSSVQKQLNEYLSSLFFSLLVVTEKK